MKDLKLNNSHDLELVDGDLLITTDGTEVAQAIKIALLTVQGEWVYDQFLGLPWYGNMFQPELTRTEILAKIRNVINGVPGIRKINKLEMTINADKEAVVTFDIESIYGIITDEVYL